MRTRCQTSVSLAVIAVVVMAFGACASPEQSPSAMTALLDQAEVAARNTGLAVQTVQAEQERAAAIKAAAAAEAELRAAEETAWAEAEVAAAKAAAEKAAAEESARQVKETAAARATKKAVDGGASTSAGAANPTGDENGAAAAPTIRWSVSVTNSGGQEAIDACSGGLTDFTPAHGSGMTFYAIHLHCGGGPVLGLAVGDLVQISGTTYTVVGVADFTLPVHSSSLAGMGGSVFVQTCHRGQNRNVRVVSLG